MPALARGGGHGGGGHGGGGHGGGGHSAGSHGGGHAGGGSHGHGGGSNLHSRGGIIYTWLPPPMVVDASERMTCGGSTVGAGDTQDSVFHACGPPSTAEQAVWVARGSEHVVEVWSYERSGSFTRRLRFENGVLQSVVSVGPLGQ